jgi:putative transposase
MYALTRRAVDLMVLRLRGDAAKDVELPVLRHQVAVLRRQDAGGSSRHGLGAPKVTVTCGPPSSAPSDRVLLAALSRVLPRERWAAAAVPVRHDRSVMVAG